MSSGIGSGYDITVTFRVDGAETLSDALHHVGLQRVPGAGPKDVRAPFSAPGVEVLNVFPVRYNVRSLKDEHRP
jgi:hypothetical protein